VDGVGYLNAYASTFPTHINTQAISWASTTNLPTLNSSFMGYNQNTGNYEADYYTGFNGGGIAHEWWIPNTAVSPSSWTSLMSLNYLGNLSFTSLSMGATAPSGSCSTNGQWQLTQDGNVTQCKSGTWTSFSGGGSGTVNSGSGYAIPAYGSAASTTIGPSNVVT